MTTKPHIAIVGAGIGGLTLGGLLTKAGIRVTVFEQAATFQRVGTGIQMGPNAVRVLRELGVEAEVREKAATPRHWRNRDGRTGELLHELPLGAEAERHFGAPYLLLHRGDLHAALAFSANSASIRTNCQLSRVVSEDNQVTLLFADGARETADVLVAADGLHSVVRSQFFATMPPIYTGRVAFRAVFSSNLIKGLELDDNTKWWGDDRHIVIYYLNKRRDEIYFTTSVPDPNWTDESWSALGRPNEVREALDTFHPHVCQVLEACPQVHKWAIADRPPLPRWGYHRVILLGDACHPMTPYMAQGAAQAMEDAAILTRCFQTYGVQNSDQVTTAYQATRETRVREIHAQSHANRWMRSAKDANWLYGYDPFNAPLTSTITKGK